MASLYDTIKLWLVTITVALLCFMGFSRGVFGPVPFGFPWYLQFAASGIPEWIIAGYTLAVTAAIVWFVHEGYAKHLSPEKGF